MGLDRGSVLVRRNFIIESKYGDTHKYKKNESAQATRGKSRHGIRVMGSDPWKLKEQEASGMTWSNTSTSIAPRMIRKHGCRFSLNLRNSVNSICSMCPP